MIFPDLTSRKYFRWLMVAACNLNSESKAKNVLLCQDVILSSNLRRLQWNAQRGRVAVFHWIYEFPVWTQNVLLRLFMKDKAFRKKFYSLSNSKMAFLWGRQWNEQKNEGNRSDWRWGLCERWGFASDRVLMRLRRDSNINLYKTVRCCVARRF